LSCPQNNSLMVDQPIRQNPQSKRAAIRWQWVILIVALLLIAGTAIFMFTRGGGGPIGPAAAPREVPLIDTQIYTEAVVGKPVLVNPLLATSQADRDLVSLIYSGLTRTDAYGQPVGDLAQSWEVSSDGLTYTFHLRPGITWHDNQPFTANDVAFTMSLLRDPKFPGPSDVGAFWRTVETYALDDQTVQFVLTQPLSAFPEYAGIGILPAHLLAGISAEDLVSDSFNLHPFGTGPLWWESLEQQGDETVVTLRPNPRFYDGVRGVKLDGVVFHFYPDPGHAFQALGPNAQGYGGLDASQLAVALNSKGLNLYSAPMPIYGAVIFNEKNTGKLPFFQEEAVRKALWLALDRQALVADHFGAQAMLTNSIILPDSWAYNASLAVPPPNAQQAGQLLDAAGWVVTGSTRAKGDTRLAFTLLVPNTLDQQKLGNAIRDAWKAIGIDVTVQTLAPADLLERLQSPGSTDAGRNFDAALVEFSQARLADPDPYAFWHDSQIESGQNFSGFSDREMDEALEIARSDSNGVRRTELYRSFQQDFVDHAAAILLYHPIYHYAVSCQVVGVQLSILGDPADRFRSMPEWKILPPNALADACP